MALPSGLTNLSQSRKAWFVAMILIISGVLVFCGKVTWSQFVDLTKWLGGTFLVGTGIEAVGKGSSPTSGAP